MGTHLRALSESYPMNTNMTGFWMVVTKLGILVLMMKVASALEGALLFNSYLQKLILNLYIAPQNLIY